MSAKLENTERHMAKSAGHVEQRGGTCCQRSLCRFERYSHNPTTIRENDAAERAEIKGPHRPGRHAVKSMVITSLEASVIVAMHFVMFVWIAETAHTSCRLTDTDELGKRGSSGRAH